MGKLLARRHGQFLLAWTLSLVLSMFWVILAYQGNPERLKEASYAVLSFGGTVFLVTVISGIGVLGFASWIEKLFAKWRFGSVAAAFGYLGLFLVLGFAIFMLAFASRNVEGNGYLAVSIGAAFAVSAPVAFVARLIYPRLSASLRVSTVVIALGLTLISFGTFSVIAMQFLPR